MGKDRRCKTTAAVNSECLNFQVVTPPRYFDSCLIRSVRAGAFLYFFLITYMFFWLDPKEPKVQEKKNGSALFFGPTHKDSDDLKVVFLFVVAG